MKHLHVRMPNELDKMLDKFCEQYCLNRSAATRLIIDSALSQPEPYAPPALLNWQTEAWTALLRGIFGDEHLVLTDRIKPVLMGAMSNLNKRQARVLRRRFGLNGPRYTLAEVGAIMGVTRERVRQVETLALARVRGWCRGRGLWDLLREQLLDEEEAR